MLNRIEFQKQITETGLHKAKLAAVVYDLFEDVSKKVTEEINQIKTRPEKACACKHVQSVTPEQFRELADTVAGLREGLASLSMKVDELDNKIELYNKNSQMPVKRLKLKEDTK
jgi:hypothetical protein